MNYVDGFMAAVPKENKEKFLEHTKFFSELAKEYGALSIVDCWEDNVPDGKVTSMPLAVQKLESEAVVFSWITWPSKEVRDEGMKKLMEDPRSSEQTNPMPFDGKRLIFGSFNVIHQSE
ncbi:DUF1428 domain-containing protein [Halobacteriovorax sp. HLS]|uniref:DUF1428 domain-containing protein n=1 Tax=Halobacteriovorax sp. HLS TaxID=2234000 RepID=UPI000FD9C84B|nr:DUF1428 domain-containing protein [Halobacteriovorax sp. HLS]